jgi:nucleoporin SEH1
MSSLPQSPTDDENRSFDLNLQHGHRDLVQAIAFNAYGDRCATGSVDGKIRVFNRHRDGTWRLCDTWSAHGGEVVEVCPSPLCPSIPLSSLSSSPTYTEIHRPMSSSELTRPLFL